MSIKNVVICGLGALGLVYADKLNKICNLKILVDDTRYKNLKNNPPIFNDKKIKLNYILPTSNTKADLIIISTKSNGLKSAIKNIKNIIDKNSIIISLINGISSEKEISLEDPNIKVLKSYFIGHSAMKIYGKYYQDGIGKIVFEQDDDLELFFKDNKIEYEISNNINYSLWVKLGVNIVLNQLSAINNMLVGDLRNAKDFYKNADNLLQEVLEIAEKENIKNLDNYKNDVLNSINLIADDGITSMLQDIRSKRKTEVEIFSGEIIKLGKKYNIKTPYNEEVYNKIKLIEKEF